MIPIHLMFRSAHSVLPAILRPLGVTLVLLLFRVAVPCAILAQGTDGDGWRLDVAGGVVGSWLSGSIDYYAGFPDCGIFSSGSGSGFGVNVGLRSPVIFGDRVRLSFGPGYGRSTGSFTGRPLDPQRARDSLGNLVDVDRVFELSYDLRTIYLDMGVDWQATDWLRVGLGASPGWRTSGRFSQVDKIASGDIGFEDGRRERSMTEGENLTLRRFALGLLLGASSDVPVGGTTRLVPWVRLRGDLFSPVAQGAWNSLSLCGGLGLSFDLSPSTTVSPEDTAVVAAEKNSQVVESSPALTAGIVIRAVDDQGRALPAATVHVREVLYRQFAPLMPVVYFERGSSLIPDRYVDLSPDRAERFTVDSLAQLNTLESYHHVLNVIGRRMRDDPSSSIALLPLSSRDESPGLSLARAQSIRTYLTGAWRIDSSRIVIRLGPAELRHASESSEEGRQENRRVEISSSSASLNAPMAIARIVRDFDPPQIELSPEYDPTRVASWQITVSRDGNVIERYSSADSENSSTGGEWEIPHSRGTGAEVPLVAELTVTDSLGNSRTARDEIPLILRRTADTVNGLSTGDEEAERLLLDVPGFGYNSAELSNRNEVLTQRIAEMIRSGASVTVTGLSSRTDDGGGRALALCRAQNVAEVIRGVLDRRGVDDVVVRAVAGGAVDERAVLPEERAFRRGATVLIEQQGSESGRFGELRR